MRKLKLGIIGSGIAVKELHLPALKTLNTLYEIKAISSRNIDHAKSLANECGSDVVAFDDPSKMTDIEVVDIAIPVNLNYDMIKIAFENGWDVICEKPIAENTHSARRILELYEKYPQRILYIAESHRHDPAIKVIKDHLSEIGNIAFFDYRLVIPTKDSKYAKTEWRKHPAHVGGFLSDGGVHHVAFLNAIFGKYLSVGGFTKQISDFTDAYDTMIMNIKYEKAFGTYSVTYAPDYRENEFSIYGFLGFLKMKDSKVTVVKGNDIKEYPIPPANFFVEEFKDFYNCVVNRQKPVLGDPYLAFTDLEMIEKVINL
ncbi:MAG: Gfo/Idh/MocA family protein [Athalassotoga sp.]|uniref:Gfo/Idh/MocA family protein n=1 Tax=Athalassotoga sp. TaxID=2022597 RepID=UPI003D0828EB